MKKKQDHSSDVPFLGNDMKDEDESATTGRDLDPSDGPGKADAELGEELNPVLR